MPRARCALPHPDDELRRSSPLFHRFLGEHRSVPPLLLRRPHSSSHGAGVLHTGHGDVQIIACRASFDVARDREVSGLGHIAVTGRASQGGFPPSTPGSSDASAFLRSCTDPAGIRQHHPCGGTARLPMGPTSLRRLDAPCGLVPTSPQAWVGSVGNGVGTVGLDPSRAYVRQRFSRCSTMVGHPCG